MLILLKLSIPKKRFLVIKLLTKFKLSKKLNQQKIQKILQLFEIDMKLKIHQNQQNNKAFRKLKLLTTSIIGPRVLFPLTLT
jgi:hypothetical protein